MAKKNAKQMITVDPRFVEACKILNDTTKWGDSKELRQVKDFLDELRHDYKREPMLHNAYGRLFRRMRQPKAAYDAFTKAKALSKIQEYPSPWLNIAIIYQEFGLWGKAEKLCREVLLIHPDHSEAKSFLQKCQEARENVCSSFNITYPPALPGDSLLLDTIELLLAAGVKVKEVKCRLSDNLGLVHEVDIMCEVYVLPGNPVPLVIECKDWSRAVSRPVIDAFRGFLNHSQFRFGMIVVSRTFTKAARASAKGSGILIRTIDDLESDMDVVLRDRLKGLKIEPTVDLTAVRPRWPDETCSAAKKLINLVSDDRILIHPDISITNGGISVSGEYVLWFETNELSCYNKILGPIQHAPFLLLLLYISWWNRIKYRAEAVYL